MLNLILELCSKYLIEFMFAGLFTALTLRYFAYKASRYDQVFFSAFTKEVEKKIQDDALTESSVDDVDAYIHDLLERVSTQLPNRGLRLRGRTPEKVANMKSQKRNAVSVHEYVRGKQSLIHSIQGESNVFKSKHPPNFKELTARIMNQDDNWVKLFGTVPIESVSRVIDVLPGIFVVIGIFGTFVGISNALPQVAQIDFNNLDNSSEVLSAFVLDITFAMKTSIAGIISSLVLSFLNALSPITVVRRSIANKLEQSLEHLWLFIQGEAAQSQNANIQERMLSVLRNIESGILTRRAS